MSAILTFCGVLAMATPFPFVPAMLTGKPVTLEDLPAHGEHMVLNGVRNCNCVAFSGDGKLLVACYGNGSIILWDVPAGTIKHRLKSQGTGVASCAISKDAKTLSHTGWEKKVRPPIGRTMRPGDLEYAEWDFFNIVYSWNLQTGAAKESLRIAKGGSTHLSADGQLLVIVPLEYDSGTRKTNRSNSAIVHDLSGKRAPITLANADTENSVPTISPDNRRIVTGGPDGRLKMWQIPSGKLLWTSERSSAMKAVAFSGDAKTFVTIGDDPKSVNPRDTIVQLWDSDAGKPKGLPIRAGSWIACLSTDGKILALHGRLGIELWDVEKREPYAILKRSVAGAALARMAFSHDDRYFVAASADSGTEVHVWIVPKRAP
jgi:eukaryotic-like serine/threonine-protein kinase